MIANKRLETDVKVQEYDPNFEANSHKEKAEKITQKQAICIVCKQKFDARYVIDKVCEVCETTLGG